MQLTTFGDEAGRRFSAVAFAGKKTVAQLKQSPVFIYNILNCDAKISKQVVNLFQAENKQTPESTRFINTE